MKKYKFTYVKLGDTWEAWKKNNSGNDGGFILEWYCKDFGFGTLTFVKNNNKTECLTEYMGKEFIQAALVYFLNNIKLVDK